MSIFTVAANAAAVDRRCHIYFLSFLHSDCIINKDVHYNDAKHLIDQCCADIWWANYNKVKFRFKRFIFTTVLKNISH